VIRVPGSDWIRDAPLIIAHRGASAYAPENTLAAFRLAEQMGADAIELDAQLTADARVVVHHDRTLDRTTSGSGRLSDHSLEEIQRLDAGSSFEARFAGERILALEEALEAMASRLLVNVDLVNRDTPGDLLPEAAVAIVQRMGLQPRVLLSSFNPRTLRRVRRLAPDIPTGLLVSPVTRGWQRRVIRWGAPHWAYHPADLLISPELIEGEHRRGRRVIGWTVDIPSRLRQLLTWGVNGVITNVPDVARRVRDEQSG
jgi:glycerophosphoryl diester phosphodiesterase